MVPGENEFDTPALMYLSTVLAFLSCLIGLLLKAVVTLPKLSTEVWTTLYSPLFFSPEGSWNACMPCFHQTSESAYVEPKRKRQTFSSGILLNE